MKNFFWFLTVPADEREQALFNIAYRASLNTLLIGLTVLFIIFSLSTHPITTDFIMVICAGLVFASYIAGWTTLRTEELTHTYASARSKELPRLRNFVLTLLSITLIFVGTIYFTPFDYFDLLLSLGATTYGIAVAYTIRSLKGVPDHIRLLVSVFLPGFGIAFAHYRTSTVLKRFFLGLAFTISYIAILIAVIVGVRVIVAEPFIIATNAFVPDLIEGQSVIVDKTDRTFEPGEYVISKTSDDKRIVSKVLAVNENELIVETSSVELTVPLVSVIGPVLTR